MKKTLLTLLLAGMSTVVNCQYCLSEGIVFEFQSQIDNFQANYPGCTGILGDVTISGPSIGNLDGLSVLTSIGGSLNLDHNPLLTGLSGLQNLMSVGNNLAITWNPQLGSLSALSGLELIDGSLWINNNDVLTSLSGLENLNPTVVADLSIHDNPALAYCALEPICNYLANIPGHLDIYNNADGCRNPPDIAGECGITLSCLPYGDYYLTCQADIDNFQEDYSNCTVLEGVVKISGPDINNLNGLTAVHSGGMYFNIVNNDLLESLEGLESLVNVFGPVSIGYNSSLVNLEGLNNLQAIGGYLSIYNNGSLLNLTGLESFTTLGSELDIQHNENLVSLAGLENLVSAGNYIRILFNQSLISLDGLRNIEPGTIGMLIVVFNSSLSSCETESICDFLAVPANFTQISDNAPGCNSREEVEEACESLGAEDLLGHESFSVYPNPSSSFIIIDTRIIQGNIELFIYSTDGREIVRRYINDPLTYIDVGQLPAGLYYGRLASESSVDVFKFIKLKRQ